MKKVKTQTEEIFESLESCSKTVAEIKSMLDSLGFADRGVKQKPATSLKVIQGGLKS